MENLKLLTSFADSKKEIVVVDVQGYVDQANCSQLESLFKELKADGCYKLIFNFKDLVYLSSAGWGVLVGEIKDIKEHGGDIKIVSMNPQVYEVYQMLEFYHILNDYPTIEDALRAFNVQEDKEDGIFADKTNGDVFELGKEKYQVNTTPDEVTASLELDIDLKDTDLLSKASMESTSLSEADRENLGAGDFSANGVNSINVDVANLPIHEKIKRVVSQYPLLSIFQIKKMLSHEEFGHERVNIFKLYSLLKKLNLETKEKRYRYWRSC